MTLHNLLRATGLVTVLPLTIAACGHDAPMAPLNTSLVGNWTLVGFTDGERISASSGDWVFFDDGIMATDLTINFPDEATSFLATVGRYEQAGNLVDLEIRGRASTWGLAFTDTEVVMTQTAPDPADDTITLRRR